MPEPDAKEKASFYIQRFEGQSNIVKQVADLSKDFGEKVPEMLIDHQGTRLAIRDPEFGLNETYTEDEFSAKFKSYKTFLEHYDHKIRHFIKDKNVKAFLDHDFSFNQYLRVLNH